MVGSLRNTEAGRLSIDARGQAVMTDSTGLLLAELQRNDLVELFASGQMDELIYRELLMGSARPKTKKRGRWQKPSKRYRSHCFAERTV